MRLRHLLLPVLLLVAANVAPAQDDGALERMKKDIFFLAGPECEGRGVETKGLEKAADYIAASFKESGLKPAAKDGSFFQQFNMTAFPEIVGGSTVTFSGPENKLIVPE